MMQQVNAAPHAAGERGTAKFGNGARWESQPRMSNTKRPIDSQDDTDISIGTISRQEGWEIEVETTNE